MPLCEAVANYKASPDGVFKHVCVSNTWRLLRITSTQERPRMSLLFSGWQSQCLAGKADAWLRITTRCSLRILHLGIAAGRFKFDLLPTLQGGATQGRSNDFHPARHVICLCRRLHHSSVQSSYAPD